MSMEHEFIQWLKSTLESRQSNSSKPYSDVVLGIGDDAAIIDHRDGLTVLATDMIADGVHFVLDETPDGLIGRKALAVNLSDLAAMAAVPKSALVSIFFPRDLSMSRAQAIYLGLIELADQYHVVIAGGDTNRWDGPLVINCAVTGTVAESRSGNRTWQMNAAQCGDSFLVSGNFGNSIAGKHLTFEPRVELALYLAANYTIHAATDITDSLSLDLASVCRQSNVGCLVDAALIPLNENERDEDDQAQDDQAQDERAQNERVHRVNAALFDGEDFEILVSASTDVADAILSDPNCPVPMTCVGTAVEGRDLQIKMLDGVVKKLDPRGYIH